MQPEIEKLQEKAFTEESEEVLAWKDELLLAKKLSEEFKTPENQAKLNQARCDLACFCGKCEEELGDIVKDKCTGSEMPNDCECKNNDEIKCEEFKNDIQCNMGCMCERCANDIELLAQNGVLGFKNVCKSVNLNQIKMSCKCEGTDCSIFQIPEHLQDAIANND